jgi:sn-glycerol 3-phosphate transport system ATP-binding protein
MNIIEATVVDDIVKSPDLAIAVPRSAAGQNLVLIGVRPESWDVAAMGTPGSITVRVELV